MSALSTFFSAGSEVPVGGYVPVSLVAAGAAGNVIRQGNKVFFRAGYYEDQSYTSIRGYGSGYGSGPVSPVYHSVSCLVGTEVYVGGSGSVSNIYKTADYKTYTMLNLPTSGTIYFMFYDAVNNKLIIALNTSLYSSSDKGATWSAGTSVGGVVRGIVYTGSKYLAITDGSNAVWSSTNSTTWTSATPAGLADPSVGTRIASNTSGRVVIAKVSSGNAASNKLYTSSDHGVTFTAVAGLPTYWASTIPEVSKLLYDSFFDFFYFIGTHAQGSGPVYYATSVLISTDGITFTTIMNPASVVDAAVYSPGITNMPIILGDVRTNAWTIFINGAGEFRASMPYTWYTGDAMMTIQKSFVKTTSSVTTGGVNNYLRLNSETLFPISNNANYLIMSKSYKEFGWSPSSVVGITATSPIYDPSVSSVSYYVRVK